ncbi:MAG: AfsR/SARP family transcriptional regulator, partial [Ktedonobacterales bacterium]
ASILEGSDAASTFLEETETYCTRLGDLSTLARLHYVRSNLAIARGALLEAERAAAAGLRYAQEANDEVRAIVCLLNLGAIRQFLGQTTIARADIEAALAQAEAAGHVQAQAYALVNLGDLELTNGKYAAALEIYERVERTMASVEDQHLSVCIATGTGYALALQERASSAKALLTQALVAISAGEKGSDWLQLTIALGFACYHDADLSHAETLLAQAISHAQAHGIRAEVVKALLALAAVRLERKHTAGAKKLLLDALEVGAHVDGTPTLLLEARHHRVLWPLLREISHPLAKELLGQLTAAADGSRATATNSTAPLTRESPPPEILVNMLGDARVRVGSECVTRWRRPRQRELLFFLLDRGEPVRGEVILDAIWPDKSPDTAEDEFRKTRSELKKALGQQYLLQQDGYWQFIAPYQLDVREFQRLAGEGEQLVAEGHSAAACITLRNALSYWSGPYLDEIYSDWAVLRREALHRRYLDVLQRLADLE